MEHEVNKEQFENVNSAEVVDTSNLDNKDDYTKSQSANLLNYDDMWNISNVSDSEKLQIKDDLPDNSDDNHESVDSIILPAGKLDSSYKHKELEEEPKSDKSEEYRKKNQKSKKNERNSNKVLNRDLITSDMFDSASKIDFNRKSKLTVIDQTKSENAIKMPNYPAHPPDRLDSS